MKKIILCTILIFLTNTPLLSNETNCKKFDLKCKTKKFIQETKEYQTKGLETSKNQLNKTKDKVIDNLKKK